MDEDEQQEWIDREKRVRAESARAAPEKPVEGVEADLPLDYMLAVVRDPATPVERRDKLAIAAAPYVHPKLAASVVVQGEATQEQMMALLADMRSCRERMARPNPIVGLTLQPQVIDLIEDDAGL